MNLRFAFLFLLPMSLLVMAWRSSFGTRRRGDITPRRWTVSVVGLVLASVTTAWTFVQEFSWYFNGGSPHGMDPAAGIWSWMRYATGPLLLSTLATSVLAKGKARWFLLPVAPGILLVMMVAYWLQFD